MSEANPVIDSSITPQGAAQLQRLSRGLSVKPRTLWGDAWRRFRKHKLAIVGAIILLLLTLTVTVGPAFYVPYRVAQAKIITIHRQMWNTSAWRDLAGTVDTILGNRRGQPSTPDTATASAAP